MYYKTKIGEDDVEVECAFEWEVWEDAHGREHGTPYVREVWYKDVDIIGALDANQIGKIEKEIDEQPASYWND